MGLTFVSRRLSGTSTVSVSDAAYDSSSWDLVSDVAPSKNAVRDKLENMGSAQVSDAAYGASWEGSVAVAPSMHVVYDKFESLPAALISDTEYGTAWSSGTSIAPSKSTVYNKIETLGTAQVSNVAFGTSWIGGTATAPSKNSVYDKITAMISDSTYGTAWGSVTDVSPSKKSVYDKIETLGTAQVSDVAYGTAWTAGTSTAPSKHVVYDEIELRQPKLFSATDRIWGRSTAGSGNAEEITCTAAARTLLDDATVSAMRATLGVTDGSAGIRLASYSFAPYDSPALFQSQCDAVLGGSTDQTTINSKISELGSAGGGMIFFAPGSINTTAAITGGTRVNLVALKGLTTITGAGTHHIITATSKTDFTISGLRININDATAPWSYYGIYFLGCTRGVVEETEIYNGRIGVAIGSASAYCDVFRSYIHGNRTGIYSTGTCDYSSFIQNNCSSNKLEASNGADGIIIENGDYCNIIDNICNDNGEHGIYLSQTSSYNLVMGNICSLNLGGNGDTGDVGIQLNGSGSGEFGNRVIGNICNGNYSIGVRAGPAVYETIIEGNVCDSNPIGIRAICAGSFAKTLIHGNTCRANGTGIEVYDMLGVRVADNRCIGSTSTGIYVRGVSYTISDVTVDGNNVYQSYYNGILVEKANECVVSGNRVKDNNTSDVSGYNGIKLAGVCDRNTVRDNRVYNSGATGQKYGISIFQADVTNTSIRDNDIRGNVTGPIYNAGVNTSFDGNIGYIAAGEERFSAGTLTAGSANAFAFAWQNPEAQSVWVKELVVDITTAGGTSGSLLDCGTGASGTASSSNLLNEVDLNAIDTHISTARLKMDASGGATDYVTGQILVGNATSLAGKYYVKYVGV